MQNRPRDNKRSDSRRPPGKRPFGENRQGNRQQKPKRPSGSKTHRAAKYSDPGAKVAVKNEEDLFAILRSISEDPFLLVLDGIQDPHNLGACLRSADAAGVHAVIAPKDRAVSITETVRTVARGAAESIPFIQVTNLARTIKELQKEGIWFVATADEASQSLYEVEMSGPLAIVIGSEGKGVRRLTAEYCDFLVRIPMAGKVECLNASVATGVCLFEAVRQRSLKKPLNI